MSYRLGGATVAPFSPAVRTSITRTNRFAVESIVLVIRRMAPGLIRTARSYHFTSA